LERAAQPFRKHLPRRQHLAAVEDIDPTALCSFDFIIALGVLKYLTDDGMKRLSAICRGKRYMIDYHPREATLFNAVHAAYRVAMGYPFYRMYSDGETKELMAKSGFRPYTLISHGPFTDDAEHLAAAANPRGNRGLHDLDC